MSIAKWIFLLFTHPNEFRHLLQFYFYHEQKRDITSMKEHSTSGWDRESMRRCWHFLDLTSRSFAAVIKELDGDLARTVSGCYTLMPSVITARQPFLWSRFMLHALIVLVFIIYLDVSFYITASVIGINSMGSISDMHVLPRFARS